MKPLEYPRPKSMEEALPLLRHGSPLAGGTWLTPRRARLDRVVDLQDLDLDGMRVEAVIDTGAANVLDLLAAYKPLG